MRYLCDFERREHEGAVILFPASLDSGRLGKKNNRRLPTMTG